MFGRSGGGLGGGGQGKEMISFIKLIRFHCRCLSCTGKQTTTADDVNPARSCRMGQTNIRLLLSYMLTSSTGPVLRRSGTALFKQSGQIMSREQSQSARERWGKRPRASSRWWEPTQHVWQIRISGDLPNPSTENSFVSSRRRASVRLPYAVSALTRIDRHSTLAVQVSEAITTTERAAATTNSYSENTFWLDGHLETISSSCVKGWASSHHQYPMSGTKPVWEYLPDYQRHLCWRLAFTDRHFCFPRIR